MKHILQFLSIGLILAVAACTYPSGSIQQGGNMQGGLYFEGAPVGARVMVDGADAGEVTVYDGTEAILAVEPGTHRVVVTTGGSTIYDEQVFVGSGSRVQIGIR
jgi:hypothetical protein